MISVFSDIWLWHDLFFLMDWFTEGSEQDFVNAITEHLFGVTIASTPDKLQRVRSFTPNIKCH